VALRFFADHCISNFIIDALCGAGNEVLRLGEYLPVESSDRRVIAKAQETDAILLSLNGDFADIVTYPPAHFKGIVSLQILNHPEVTRPLLARLVAYLAAHPAPEDYRGKLISVEVDRIRIRE
jgi:predicted nuclease of predicted toxin-antitoxin system